MESQARPEPMNASPHHSKVKVSLTLPDPLYVAGKHVSGKVEMECRADKGLGIGMIMVELFAIQELTSRDHSATSTFLHSRRLFQGPGLPPSNAVLPHPLAGEPPLPSHHHQARRGVTTFLFRFPLPETTPSAINFGSGLARIRYEIRASVGVSWKGDRRLVTDKKEVDVVECLLDAQDRPEPAAVVVGENGKFWMHGRVVGGIAVAGESACVELQVKNHSTKKNTGLSVTLTRSLHLPDLPPDAKSSMHISDTLANVAFRGPEYIIQPGAEGVANLVFDVPKDARGVKGGLRHSSEEDGRRTSECLFEVRCVINVKLNMGLTSKDIDLRIPVTIVHPLACPELPPVDPFPSSSSYTYSPPLMSPGQPPIPPISPIPFLDRAQSPYDYPILPISPPLQPFIDQGQVWLSPPLSHTPQPYHYFSPPAQGQPYYFPSTPNPPSAAPFLARSVSTGHPAMSPAPVVPSGLPASVAQLPSAQEHVKSHQRLDSEEGKGERASRIAYTLRMSSRHRSVSPQSHRFPVTGSVVRPLAQPSAPSRPSVQRPLHIDITDLAASPASSQGIVHSPRPIPSPHHTYTVDPFTLQSLPKSDRVETLERIADQVLKESKDLSGDVPKDLMVNIDKTLPGPPIPSGKDRLHVPQPSRPRADTLFELESAEAMEDDPRTPLAAVTPIKLTRSISSPLRGGDRQDSGLDLLERRLLAEVGTRKMEQKKYPDVRAVLPIDIPATKAPVDPAVDSAISSLTLAGNDLAADDGTQRPHRRSQDAHSREGAADEGANTVKWKEGERARAKKKDRGKEDEALRLRKEAKGRVAAWLGGIDPEAAPLTDSPQSPSALLPDANDLQFPMEKIQTSVTADSRLADGEADKDVLSAPNPRSSGFVPMMTYRRLHPEAFEDPSSQRADEFFDDPSATPGTTAVSTSSTADESKRPVTTKDEKPHVQPTEKDLLKGTPAKVTTKVSKTPDLLAKLDMMSKRPQYPLSDPEVKYDHRSARGGRGGRVTAVASFWASATAHSVDKAGPSPKPIISSPLVAHPQISKPLKERRDPVRNVEPVLRTKAASVPAVISSSHARPMLSSTASLAYPSPNMPRAKAPTVSTVPESSIKSFEVVPPVSPAKSPIPGELAFGRAKLRDLIKKYDGQGS